MPLETNARGSERRSAPRQSVGYRLDVLGPAEVEGCLLDVSLSGMRVRFRGAIDVASTESLRISFPRWLELGAGLDVRGRFAWMRVDPKGFTEAGFGFEGLGRKDQALLALLIQRLAEALEEDGAVLASA